MKVLIINAVCGSGSTGRIVSDMYSLLKEKGHEVKVVYGVGKATRVNQEDLIRCNNKFGYYLHNALARLTDGAGYYSVYATSKLIKKIKAFNPDVIQLHNLHGFYINIEILFRYLKSTNKKVVWTLHDCWAFTGHSAYCDAIKCEKWKTGCSKCPQISAYPKALIDRSKRNWKRKKKCFSGVSNMTIVTPSHWLAGLTRESFLGEYPVEVIHNGIDTAQFRPLPNDFREFHGLEHKFIILGVATAWDNMKGYSDFLKLAELLDDDCQVVLVGLTEEQIQKLPSNILGIKRTSSVKELTYIYSSADVFLNLTYCDNYPTVNLEARACGTPVITYDTGGSSESAGEAGILVKQGDIDALVEEITKLKSMPQKLDVNPDQFDQNECLKEYTHLYDAEKSNRGGYWSEKYKLNIKDKFIVLGIAFSWDDMKGYSDFLKLAELLGDNYQIVMVGLTEEQIQNLPPNIHGIARTSNVDELAAMYGSADVFLNLTYCDSFGLVNIEAALCGTYVISYDTGGCRESVAGHGVLVPQGDLDEVVKTISYLKDQKKMRSIPEKEPYDRKRTLEQYYDVYSSELSNRGGYWSEKSKYGLIGKQVILGVAAVWDKRKGLPDFVELQKLLDETYRILLVGLSEEQISGLPAGIKGLRKTESVAQLATLYSIADAFVNPTYEDNFPTTNIEALACGAPVVTYNTGGSGESVDEYSGTIVEQGDIEGIRNAIFSTRKIRIKQILSRSKKFNKNDRYMEYLKLYEKSSK